MFLGKNYDAHVNIKDIKTADGEILPKKYFLLDISPINK